MISTMRFIVMCLCLTVTSSAYAGSYRRFFYGDDAAMTASAGTALMTDTGAIWYNPAGLGGNQFKKLQLSGTAYGLHVRRLNKILQTHINDQSHIVGKSLNNVSIVPSAFSVAFALNDKVSFGFGLFQTENNTFSLRAAQTLDITPVSSWNAGMEYHEKTIQYTAGPALGIQISDDLKWGIANFGVYDSQDASLRLHAGYNRDNTSGQSDTMGIDSQYLQRQVATTYVTTGIQWRVSDNWHSGLLLRSPAFQLWRQRSLSQFDATAFDYSPSNQTSTTVAGESIIFEYVEDSESSFDTKITAPGEIRLAIAYCPGPNWVGAEVGYQLPLEKENHHQVFNASLGAHMKLTPKAGVGIGLFTDNDSQRGLKACWSNRETVSAPLSAFRFAQRNWSKNWPPHIRLPTTKKPPKPGAGYW